MDHISTAAIRWWIKLAVGTLIPAPTLLPFFELGNRFFPPSRWFPQSFTNEIPTWADCSRSIFVLALRSMHTHLQITGDSGAAQSLSNAAAMTGGLMLLLILEYGWLFSAEHLVTLFQFDALRIIIAIPFVPVLATVGIISTFTCQRTRSYLPGALICSLLITWYVVAGQATHFTR